MKFGLRIKLSGILLFSILAVAVAIVSKTEAASTGAIVVERVGSSDTSSLAPSGTEVGLDSTSHPSSDNSTTFNAVAPGQHIVYVTDDVYEGYAESIEVCNYPIGGSGCGINDSRFQDVTGCDQDNTGYCGVPVDVTSGMVTSLVFKYVQGGDTSEPIDTTGQDGGPNGAVAETPGESNVPVGSGPIATTGSTPSTSSGPASSSTPLGSAPGASSVKTGSGPQTTTISLGTPAASTNPFPTSNPTPATPDQNTSWINGLVPCGNPSATPLTGNNGLDEANYEASSTGAGGCGLNSLIVLGERIINFLFFAAVMMTVCLLVYTGFEYLTAGGNTGTLDAAKKRFWTITKGFILVCAAWLIINTLVTLLLDPAAGIQNPLSTPNTTTTSNP